MHVNGVTKLPVFAATWPVMATTLPICQHWQQYSDRVANSLRYGFATPGKSVDSIRVVADNVQKQYLRRQLKTLRLDSGLSVQDVASQLGKDLSTIYRWESGARTPGEKELQQFLEVVGASDAARHDMLRTEKQSEDSVWLTWTRGTDRRRYMAALMRAEERATRITHVAPNLMPGLVQTYGYARALMIAGGADEDEAGSRIAERLGRREILANQPRPPHLDIVLDEAVLHRQLGGPDVLRAQLSFLLERCENPMTTVTVVPFTAEINPMGDGQFVLIESNDDEPIVYQETRGVSLFFNEEEDVASYRQVVGAAKKAAMSPEESKGLIARVLKEIDQQ